MGAELCWHPRCKLCVMITKSTKKFEKLRLRDFII